MQKQVQDTDKLALLSGYIKAMHSATAYPANIDGRSFKGCDCSYCVSEVKLTMPRTRSW